MQMYKVELNTLKQCCFMKTQKMFLQSTYPHECYEDLVFLATILINLIIKAHILDYII